MNDNIPPDLAASYFNSFSGAYLDLVDKLIKKGIDKQPACDIAMTLVINFFNFQNNDKFAERGMLVQQEQEQEE